MHSPVNWALLGLVIERPSYAYELAQRFERTYGQALPLSSVSHAYAALGTLKDRGLIEELPGTKTGRQPKPHYRATAKGMEDYHAWLIGQVADERRRQEVFLLQLTALTREPGKAMGILKDYEQACLQSSCTTLIAKDVSGAPDSALELPGEADRRGEAPGDRRQDRVGPLRAPRAQGARERPGGRPTRWAGRRATGELIVSLLELAHVCKRRTYGGRTVTVLDDASLSVDPGELVAVWGLRGSGRTTLLRLAAGIDAPDSGTVRFDGRDLAEHGEEILGREIGYCQKSFPSAAPGKGAIEEVIVGLLINGVAPAQARGQAREALARVRGEGLAQRLVRELDSGERVRLAIAHALALQPRLLLIDEPVAGVDLHQRDDVLLLARSLADEGIAVLMTVGELTGLTGADQSLTIGDGELSGSRKRALAPVADLSLRRRASG